MNSPHQYKYWYHHLQVKFTHVKHLHPNDQQWIELESLFETIVKGPLKRFPRIWLLYTEFLTTQKYITKTRRAFDRALQNTSPTQHFRIWPPYLDFANNLTCLKTRNSIVFRHLIVFYQIFIFSFTL